MSTPFAGIPHATQRPVQQAMAPACADVFEIPQARSSTPTERLPGHGKVASVTGATGHIGANLVRMLVADGYKVRALVRSKSDCWPLPQSDQVTVYRGDVLRPETLDAFVRGAHLVFHLAAKINLEDPNDDEMHFINVYGTHNILQACQRAGAGRVVFCGSVHALRAAKNIDEKQPLVDSTCANGYDLTKALAEAEVLEAVRNHQVDAVIVNPTGVLGPHDYRGSRLGRFFRGVWKCAPAVQGAYDMVDVRDVCRGMLLAAQRGKSGERYILGGRTVSISELVVAAQKSTGQRSYFAVPGFQTPITIPWTVAKWSVPVVEWVCNLFGWAPLMSDGSLEVLKVPCTIDHTKAARELGYEARPLAGTVRDIFAWQDKQRG